MVPLSIAALALLFQSPPSAFQHVASGAPEAAAPSAQTLAVASLVDAELVFARTADREGTQAAFLSVLDDTGVVFRPGPVNGKAWFRGQKPENSKLAWFPSFVDVSAAGDLGYSTGPYTWRATADAKDVFHGHFVSIWGRRAGTWKLLLDTGSPHPAPEVGEPIFDPAKSNSSKKGTILPTFTAASLEGLEKAFAQAVVSQGLIPACNTYLAAHARVYRAGSFPATRPEELRKVLEKVRGDLTWTCLGSAVAKSFDLGYTYGLADISPKPAVPPVTGAETTSAGQRFTFLHVWQRQPTGRWQVVLDLQNPLR